GFDRFRRDDKYDRVGLRVQATEARLPILASRNVVAVAGVWASSLIDSRFPLVVSLATTLSRIGVADSLTLSCASVGHGLPRSILEIGTREIGHMCRGSETADLIVEIR